MENQNPQELTQAQAVNVLIQAARIAQSKGAFTLEDAELVSKAIKAFVPVNQTENGQDPVINESQDETVEPVIEKA
jgi:hypothetical protein